jgi:hypothetical protein
MASALLLVPRPTTPEGGVASSGSYSDAELESFSIVWREHLGVRRVPLIITNVFFLLNFRFN